MYTILMEQHKRLILQILLSIASLLLLVSTVMVGNYLYENTRMSAFSLLLVFVVLCLVFYLFYTFLKNKITKGKSETFFEILKKFMSGIGIIIVGFSLVFSVLLNSWGGDDPEFSFSYLGYFVYTYAPFVMLILYGTRSKKYPFIPHVVPYIYLVFVIFTFAIWD